MSVEGIVCLVPAVGSHYSGDVGCVANEDTLLLQLLSEQEDEHEHEHEREHKSALACVIRL